MFDFVKDWISEQIRQGNPEDFDKPILITSDVLEEERRKSLRPGNPDEQKLVKEYKTNQEKKKREEESRKQIESGLPIGARAALFKTGTVGAPRDVAKEVPSVASDIGGAIVAGGEQIGKAAGGAYKKAVNLITNPTGAGTPTMTEDPIVSKIAENVGALVGEMIGAPLQLPYMVQKNGVHEAVEFGVQMLAFPYETGKQVVETFQNEGVSAGIENIFAQSPNILMALGVTKAGLWKAANALSKTRTSVLGKVHDIYVTENFKRTASKTLDSMSNDVAKRGEKVKILSEQVKALDKQIKDGTDTHSAAQAKIAVQEKLRADAIKGKAAKTVRDSLDKNLKTVEEAVKPISERFEAAKQFLKDQERSYASTEIEGAKPIVISKRFQLRFNDDLGKYLKENKMELSELFKLDDFGRPKYIKAFADIADKQSTSALHPGISNNLIKVLLDEEVSGGLKIGINDTLPEGVTGQFIPKSAESPALINLRALDGQKLPEIQLAQTYKTLLHEGVHWVFQNETEISGLMRFLNDAHGISFDDLVGKVKEVEHYNKYNQDRYSRAQKDLLEARYKDAIEGGGKFSAEEQSLALNKKLSGTTDNVAKNMASIETLVESTADAIGSRTPQEFIGKAVEEIFSRESASKIADKIISNMEKTGTDLMSNLNKVVSDFYEYSKKNKDILRDESRKIRKEAWQQVEKLPDDYEFTEKNQLVKVGKLRDMFDKDGFLDIGKVPKKYHNKSITSKEMGLNKIFFSGSKYFEHPLNKITDGLEHILGYKIEGSKAKAVLNDAFIKPALDEMGKSGMRSVKLSEFNDFNRIVTEKAKQTPMYNPEVQFYNISKRDLTDPASVRYATSRIQSMVDLFGDIKLSNGRTLRQAHNITLRELGIQTLNDPKVNLAPDKIMHNLKKLNPELSAIWDAVDKKKLGDEVWINRALNYYQQKVGAYGIAKNLPSDAPINNYPNITIPLAHLRQYNPKAYNNILKRAGIAKNWEQLTVGDMWKIAQTEKVGYDTSGKMSTVISRNIRPAADTVSKSRYGLDVTSPFFETYNLQFAAEVDQILARPLAPWKGRPKFFKSGGSLIGNKHSQVLLEYVSLEQYGRYLCERAGIEITPENIRAQFSTHNKESFIKRYDELLELGKNEKIKFKIDIREEDSPFKDRKAKPINGDYGFIETANIMLERTINPITEALADWWELPKDRRIKNYLPIQGRSGEWVDIPPSPGGKGGGIFHFKEKRTGGINELEWGEINHDPFMVLDKYLKNAYYERYLAGYKQFVKDLSAEFIGREKLKGGVLPDGISQLIQDSFRGFTGKSTRLEVHRAKSFYENIGWGAAEGQHWTPTGIAKALFIPSAERTYALVRVGDFIARKILHRDKALSTEAIKLVKEEGKRFFKEGMESDTVSPKAYNYVFAAYKQMMSSMRLYGSPAVILQQKFQPLHSAVTIGIRPTIRAMGRMLKQNVWDEALSILTHKELNKLSGDKNSVHLAGMSPQVLQDILAGGNISEIPTTAWEAFKYKSYWNPVQITDWQARMNGVGMALNYWEHGPYLLKGTKNNIRYLFEQGLATSDQMLKWSGAEAFCHESFSKIVETNLRSAETIKRAILNAGKNSKSGHVKSKPILLDGIEYSLAEAEALFNKKMQAARGAYAFGFAQFGNHFYDAVNGLRSFGMEKVGTQMMKFPLGQIQTLARSYERMIREFSVNHDKWQHKLPSIAELYRQKQAGDWRATGTFLRKATGDLVLYYGANTALNTLISAITGDDPPDKLDLGNFLPLNMSIWQRVLTSWGGGKYQDGSGVLKDIYNMTQGLGGPGMGLQESMSLVMVGTSMHIAEKASGKEKTIGSLLFKMGMEDLMRQGTPAAPIKMARMTYEALAGRELQNITIAGLISSMLPDDYQKALRQYGIKAIKTGKEVSRAESVMKFLGAWNYGGKSSADYLPLYQWLINMWDTAEQESQNPMQRLKMWRDEQRKNGKTDSMDRLKKWRDELNKNK